MLNIFSFKIITLNLNYLYLYKSKINENILTLDKFAEAKMLSVSYADAIWQCFFTKLFHIAITV